MAEKNGTTKRVLISIIITLGTLLLGYSVTFISYNYAEDAKRDARIEEVKRIISTCKEVDATQTANIEAIKDDIKETKDDVKTVMQDVRDIKHLLIQINRK